MSFSNFWSTLDTDAPEPHTEPAPQTKKITCTAYVSKKKMREMSVAAEVPLETTTIDTSITHGNDTTDTDEAKDTQDDNSTQGNAGEDDEKDAEYAAEKKAKKAAKKLRQKMKKGDIIPDVIEQDTTEVTEKTNGTQNVALATPDSEFAADANGGVGDAGLAVASNANGTKFEPTEDVFFDAINELSKSELAAIDELAAFNETDLIVHGDKDVNHPAPGTPASAQINPLAVNAPVPRKNTIANKRKKANKRKALEAKIEAEIRAKLQEDRIKTVASGLFYVFFICMLLWGLYTISLWRR